MGWLSNEPHRHGHPPAPYLRPAHGSPAIRGLLRSLGAGWSWRARCAGLVDELESEVGNGSERLSFGGSSKHCTENA